MKRDSGEYPTLTDFVHFVSSATAELSDPVYGAMKIGGKPYMETTYSYYTETEGPTFHSRMTEKPRYRESS